MYDIEQALRDALNGAPVPKSKNATIRKNFAPPSYYPHKVTARYSVQQAWGGPRFAVTYEKNTISSDEVVQMAYSDIERNGYTNVVLLEITRS